MTAAFDGLLAETPWKSESIRVAGRLLPMPRLTAWYTSGMSIGRRDYILRMIEQFAEAMARVLGLRKSGDLAEAERRLRETADGIFGPMRGTLDALAPVSAAALLSNVDKTRIYAAITAEEAAIREARGEVQKARAGRRRALELYLEAARGDRTIDPRTREAIAALRGGVDEERLGERYKDQLAAVMR